MSAKLIFTSYKDTRGKSSLGREISEALGIESQWKGSATEGPISLVELREGDGGISVTAHGKNNFAELVVHDAGKTTLKETNGNAGEQERTILWPNGKLLRTRETWDAQRGGLLGDRREIAVPDEAAARQRVERIAKRVLPLARNI